MTERKPISNILIKKIKDGKMRQAADVVAYEEPLEIRLAYFLGKEVKQQNLAVTMRTPGHDRDLALGFLFTEGIIQNKKDVVKAEYLAHKSEQSRENRLLIGLAKGLNFDPKKLERHFYTSSSCGVCGKSSIEAVFNQCDMTLHDVPLQVSDILLSELPNKMRNAQRLFEETGGIHAAALFNKKGELLLLREDVGRHNAVDKVIGAALLSSDLTLSECILQVSGRTSFELVQKTLQARIPILSAVGAPSSLAVELAVESGMTLLGFVKNNRLNVYSGAERIRLNQRTDD